MVAAALVLAAAAHASPSSTQIYEKNLRTSEAIVTWWQTKGHWALFPRFDHCWQVTGYKQRQACRYARKSYTLHRLRVERLDTLLHPPAPVYGMANPLCQSSCISCESGWNPMAWNAAGYWGLYQFDRGTWAAHGGDPSQYGSAGASEQHRVAANIGYDAWPNC